MTVMDAVDVKYDVVQTPIDRLIVASDGESIVGVWMANASPDDEAWSDRRGANELLKEARRQLTAYFTSTLKTFDLPLAPNGTEFQRRVWSALCEIPFGQTLSYLDLAHRVGNPAAV